MSLLSCGDYADRLARRLASRLTSIEAASLLSEVIKGDSDYWTPEGAAADRAASDAIVAGNPDAAIAAITGGSLVPVSLHAFLRPLAERAARLPQFDPAYDEPIEEEHPANG